MNTPLTVPMDKQPRTATKKPITPALSSRFRHARAPLAPRLAGSAPATPAFLARREAKPAPITSDAEATILTGNVTPRSGARSSRIGTDSPGTPGSLRRPSTTGTIQSSTVAGSPATTGNLRLAATNAQGGAIRRTSGSSAISRRDGDDAKFFYAGDVRPAMLMSGLPNQQGPKSAATGFIRTGDAPIDSLDTFPITAESRAASEMDAKFLRANDIPTAHVSRTQRPAMVKQLTSTSASSMRNRSPDGFRQRNAPSPQLSPRRPLTAARSRPGSPIKNFVASPHMVALPDSPYERRKSIGSGSVLSTQSARSGHKKSASVSTVPRSTSPPPLMRLQMPDPNWTPPNAQQSRPGMLASPDTLSPRSTSLNSSKTVGTNTTNTTNDTDVSDIAKFMLAVKEAQIESAQDATRDPLPTPPIPALTQAQVDAANARRERKVLDLEISNSSLLAINKTLERELRKQTAEIRRFRRLSRSGRLSFAPTNRSVSAQSMLSALSEEGNRDGLQHDSSGDDEDEESDLSDVDEENLSDTDSITARSRRRAREERRLMLDLSKHQQLLIDSQRLSQSMRKCLDLTEELIKDGKKALEYRVGIGDVKLGGRVLNADEFAIDAETHGYVVPESQSRRALLSPSLSQAEMQEANLWLSVTQGESGTHDETRTQQQLLPMVDGSNLNPGMEQTEPG